MPNHFKIIVPFYNVEDWIKICIRSIKAQSYTNFQCILIDDLSDDNTEEIVKKEISGDRRFSLVRPEEKAYALKNIYDAITLSSPNNEDIIVTLDGDDWFANKHVLRTLNNVYLKNDCWITYGSYAEYPSGKRGKFAKQIDQSFIDNKTLRQKPWMSSHLRTFKAKLWNQIKHKDLLDSEGNFYRMTWDLAFMFPMLEMAGPKSKYVEDILYVYNMSNPMNDHKVDNSYQRQLEAEIRAKPPYETLQEAHTTAVGAQTLYSASRFDIGAKIAYIKDYLKNIDCDWSKELYLEHLRVWNNFKEAEPKKDGPQDFINSFNDLTTSLVENGMFKNAKSSIPIVNIEGPQNIAALNGAHRIAVCNLLEFDDEWSVAGNTSSLMPVHAAPISAGQLNCSYEYFKNKTDFVPGGLAEKYLDYMNLEFIKAHAEANSNPCEFEACRVVTLFPSANITTQKAIEILSKYCSVISYKNLELNELGQFNYIMNLYIGEEWLGSMQENHWPGAIEKQKACFDGDQELRVILVNNTTFDKLNEAKEEIRQICQKGKHSIHINDTNLETWRIATSIYNENSIHFLNNSRIFKVKQPFLKFCDQFMRYVTFQNQYIATDTSNERGERSLKVPTSPLEDFAIDASSTLSAYGIREGGDLDFLFAYFHISSGMEDVSCHNMHVEDYEESIHDMIYHPKNYFWFFGRKFVTLEVVRKMKENRNEPKDQRDVKLIDEVLNGI